MPESLFDVATIDPGVRRRFAEDRYAPMRVVLTEHVHVEQGPCVGVDELDDLFAAVLTAWGVTIHAHHFEAVEDDMRWTAHVIDASLLAESQAHASEQLQALFREALHALEYDYDWFEHNDPAGYRPKPRRNGGA